MSHTLSYVQLINSQETIRYLVTSKPFRSTWKWDCQTHVPISCLFKNWLMLLHNLLHLWVGLKDVPEATWILRHADSYRILRANYTPSVSRCWLTSRTHFARFRKNDFLGLETFPWLFFHSQPLIFLIFLCLPMNVPRSLDVFTIKLSQGWTKWVPHGGK